MSIGVRLTYEVSCETAVPTAYIVNLGWDEVRFVSPGRPGDRLIFEREVISKRAGIVGYANRLINQREDLVVSYKTSALVEKRPKA